MQSKCLVFPVSHCISTMPNPFCRHDLLSTSLRTAATACIDQGLADAHSAIEHLAQGVAIENNAFSVCAPSL